MCGITGVINNTGEPLKEGLVEEMMRAVAHRGPDAEGIYFKDNVALGHKRLSIFDLSDAGKQPMGYMDRYTIVFNGAIYNFPEIKAELSGQGYIFSSATDTEVIMAAYDNWGEECVQRFNGMWSFAIYDEEKGMVFCSRDRFGIKPFYYTQAGDIFAFGSEIKQLLPLQDVVRVNKSTLINYLVLGMEEYTAASFFVNINKLPAAHNMVIDTKTGNKNIYRYYTLKPERLDEQLTEEEIVAKFYERFQDAVRLRLRSDVKVGTCLSGGLDSSSIAAVASNTLKKEKKKFSAVTAASSDQSKDETPYARAVAEHLELDWNVYAPQKEEFHSILDKVIYLQEEPFGGPSIFMQYFVMKMAKDAQITVLLDGQGSDEILLGYERYYPSLILEQPFLRKIPALLRASKYSKLSLLQVVSYMFYFTQPKARLARQHRRFSFVRKEYLKNIDKDIITALAAAQRNVEDLQQIEVGRTQLPHLLKYEDRNSMHFAIETRLPFLDYRLVELAMAVPSGLKIKEGWTKYILRRAVEDILPKEIAWRKNKIGFEAPVKEWLKDRRQFAPVIEESHILKEICKEIPIDTMDDLAFWKILNIAIWEKLYNVQL